MSDEPNRDDARTYDDAVLLIANCFTAFQEQPLAERLDVIAIAQLWETTPEIVERDIRARWEE